MKTTNASKKKFLLGLSVSLVLAMAIGSFAIGDNQTPGNTHAENRSAVSAPDSGSFIVTATDGETVLTDNDYSYDGDSSTLTIKSTTPMTIKNTDPTTPTTDRILISSDSLTHVDTVDLTLAGVNINEESAFQIQQDATFNVNITLKDGTKNILTSTGTDCAGLEKAVTNLSDADGDLRIGGTGELIANGGPGSAGIGGWTGNNTDNIYITGGKITATGGYNAAGIGGGNSGKGNNITITGGVVKATGGNGAAGIGGGNGATGSCSGNSIDEDVVVIAKSGDLSVDAIDSNATISGGITFIYNAYEYWESRMYSPSVTITEDLELPVSFDINSRNEVTVADGSTVTAVSGAGLYVTDGTLINEGTIDIPADYITCGANSSIKTLLKYDPQGGSFSGLDDSYQLYQDGNGADKPYTNLPTPITNETFNGWNTKEGGAGDYLYGITVDLNLHKAYADMDYTVKFDSQGGSEVMSDIVKYKGKATKPADPTKEGYTFDAWYKDEGCTTLWDFDKDTVQSDTTLYAGWTADPTPTPPTPTPSVIVPVQPDNGNIEVLTQNPSPGDTVIFMVTPDEGYQVKGLPKAQILRQSFIARLFGNDIGIDVQSLGDNKYSFVMPNDNVAISAEFEQIPTPTPPGPEPEPTPTPEPTPDPSVDPDGGDGSGASSKTSDPFMGGVALALLGVATTGAVLVRKRK